MMRRTLAVMLFVLLSSFLFAVPASAFDLPACAPFPNETTDFVLIAQDNIIFEPQTLQAPPRIIQGNVLVTSPHPPGGSFSNTGVGFIRVGSNTNIQGTVIADVLLLPDAGATITHCIANQIVANTPAAQASCGTGYPVVGTPFTDYATAHPTCVGSLTSGLCGPNPVVNPCVNGQPKLTVGVVFPTPAQAAAGLTDPLAPGCYGALVIEAGAVLNLAPGTFTFASVEMKAGARLNGGPSTVNVNGLFLANAGVFITDIDLNVAAATSAEIVKILNNSTLTNVDINAPFGKCHLHTGSFLTGCSEACCKVLDVEPIRAECDAPGLVCVCPAGTRFELPPFIATPNNSPADIRARNCVPCQPGDGPPCP